MHGEMLVGRLAGSVQVMRRQDVWRLDRANVGLPCAVGVPRPCPPAYGGVCIIVCPVHPEQLASCARMGWAGLIGSRFHARH